MTPARPAIGPSLPAGSFDASLGIRVQLKPWDVLLDKEVGTVVLPNIGARWQVTEGPVHTLGARNSVST